MLEKWFELEEIVKSVVYKPGGDALVWVYNSNGIYSTSSLYTIINFRGVQPVFLWLLSNNKLMTVDNLAERGIHKPLDCKFCSEKESIHHLFFECIIARQLGHTFLILMVLLSILTLIWLVNGLLRKNINPQTQSLQELFGAYG